MSSWPTFERYRNTLRMLSTRAIRANFENLAALCPHLRKAEVKTVLAKALRGKRDYYRGLSAQPGPDLPGRPGAGQTGRAGALAASQSQWDARRSDEQAAGGRTAHGTGAPLAGAG